MRFQSYHKHTPAFNTFLIKNAPNDRYTKKHPTHFSIASLRPKLKQNFFEKAHRSHNLVILKKIKPNPQKNLKNNFRNSHF